MLRRLIFLLLAAPLAWYLAPLLSGIALFGLITIGEVAQIIAPHDLTDRDGAFYVQFIFWLVLISLLLAPSSRLFFGVLAPQSKRYSETKLFRRIQGIIVETGFVLLVAVLLSLFLYSQEKEKDEHLYSAFQFFGLFEEEQNFAAPEPRLESEEFAVLKGLLLQEGEIRSRLRPVVEASILADPALIRVDGAIVYADRGTRSVRERITYSDEELVEHIRANQRLMPTVRRIYSTRTRDLAFNVGGTEIDAGNFRGIEELVPTEQKINELLHIELHRYGSEMTETPRSTRRSAGYFLTEVRILEQIAPAYLELVKSTARTVLPATRTRQVPIEEYRAFPVAEIESQLDALVAGFEGRIDPSLQPKIELYIWWKTVRGSWLLLLVVSAPIGLMLGYVLKPWIHAFYAPVIRFFDQGRMGYGGAARFAGCIEEWSYLKRKNRGGLILGKSMFSPFLSLSMKDDRHMVTIAGTRGGKGTSAIIPNLLSWDGSAVVIDPKGTNAAVTARRRREMGQKVYVIDPFGVLGEESDSFNPLQGFDPEKSSIHRDIDFIVNAMVVAKAGEKSDDDHWIEGAKTVLRGFIAQILSDEHYEDNRRLGVLRNMLSFSDDEKAELFAAMSLNEGAGKIAKETASRIIDGIETQEIKNILSNANAQTEWLRNEQLQEVMVPEPTFSFAELKEKPTTVYLVIPPDEIKANMRFVRMFINLVIRQVYQGGRSKTPILMIMDEFPELGRMEEVVSAFAVAAGYNLVMWPFIQNLGQMKKFYKDEIETIIGNSRAVQVFAVGDPETAEFVSKRLGTRATGGLLEVRTASNALPLREPADVSLELNAQHNLQYILRAGRPALLLEKKPYFKRLLFEHFTKKPYDPDPDHG